MTQFTSPDDVTPNPSEQSEWTRRHRTYQILGQLVPKHGSPLITSADPPPSIATIVAEALPDGRFFGRAHLHLDAPYLHALALGTFQVVTLSNTTTRLDDHIREGAVDVVEQCWWILRVAHLGNRRLTPCCGD